MDNQFIVYILGYLFTQTFLVIWFYSPLRITIGQILFDRDLYTVDQFETFLLLRSTLLGKLLSCYICLSFWISLLIGLGTMSLHLAPLWYALVTAGTYPAICYLYKSLTDRS